MADLINTSSGTMAAIVPELWSGKWYPAARAAIPFIDAISYDYEEEVNRKGDTVRIPDMSTLTAEEITEGTAVSAQELSNSTTSLVIDKEVAADVKVTNKADLQSIPFMARVQEELREALIQKVQSIIIDTIVPSASSPDHQISYDSGTTLAAADILEAKDLLDAQNTPNGGMRFLITGTAQHNDMLSISNLIDKDTNLGDTPAISGVIKAPVYGFRAYSTTAVSTETHLFHPWFMQAAFQQVPQIDVFNIGNLGERAYRVNATLLFSVKQIKDTWVVTIS